MCGLLFNEFSSKGDRGPPEAEGRGTKRGMPGKGFPIDFLN